jgi:alanyl-tRNA synthetase
MGLERMTQVMQGKRSVFECDLFSPLVERVCEMSGQCLGERKEMDRVIRIVAEHGRAATFLIADGVFPQNTGKGYVLRRIVRRASVFGRKLGFKNPFLVEIARLVIRDLSSIYPELSQNQSLIESILNSEEEGFGRNLATALDLVDRTMGEKKGKGISGKEAFLLYDTYGLPLDILQEVAQERGFEVDLEGFNEEMERQRQRTRGVAVPDLGLARDEVSVQRGTQFVGYDSLFWEKATIREIRAREGGESKITEGEEAELILDVTPFYGEMGGQMGDEGEILGRKGRFLVEDTKRSHDLILHQGKVTWGSLEVGEKVEAKVDEGSRKDIARNHTATHLLQGALRKVLGEHVHQAGSEVTPDHLRFDFTHHGKLTKELSEVEGLVNRWIREGLSVSWEEDIPLDEAKSKGALALFGEKYGDRVRVVKISPVSLEVCGGTHVNTTSELGLFIITQESGIGAGVRRIEAVTGKGVENYIQQQRCILQEVAVKLEAKSGEDVLPKLDEVLGELTEERRHAQCLRQGLVKMVGERLTQDAKIINGIKLVEGEVTELNPDELRSVGDELKKALGSVLIVLRTRKGGRQNMIVMVTPDLVSRGLHAGNMAGEVAESLGGGGGGGAELGRGSFPSSRLSNSKVMEVIKNLGQNFGD